MKVTEHIENAGGKTLISFEILPPLKGGSMANIFKALDPLMEFKPPFIDVTYHREEFLYQMQPSGFYQKFAIRKRPGTVGICSAIMHRYECDAVPHLICGGFSKEDTENALIDLNFLGISNILALRGDARKFETDFMPEPAGHEYALDLVSQIQTMNQGIYLDSGIEKGSRTEFCIGVAGYPEKHFESPNLIMDIKYLKMKIDAGADYIVTQMFYDNEAFFRYVDMCRAAGITVPIIAGLKPITKLYQLKSIPRHFYVNMPEALIKEAEKITEDAQMKELGIEWCISQSKELKERGVSCLHYYTMGDSSSIRKICSQII
ncbi:MAG TPA: methylenetetrahydrofolate reductase [NAD(P)H] [Saprospiraceae bacterium]|nr:methylenetetrahydrofolate reductase [NAD(P)H] [Saprospiraceae bacterium]HQW57200.1 methylenetetrahydrofolate reductase [NAD(P)H] [Saprospiraceae bacterium]